MCFFAAHDESRIGAIALATSRPRARTASAISAWCIRTAHMARATAPWNTARGGLAIVAQQGPPPASRALASCER